RGQIVVLTYPLVGNYGVPTPARDRELPTPFESDRIQVSGLIVSEASQGDSHWSASTSFSEWLRSERNPALMGRGTAAPTQRLRAAGTMLGKIVGAEDVPFEEPNDANLVSSVSVKAPIVYPGGPTRIVLVDCGCKASIIRSLLARGVTVVRVPWDYDFLDEPF